MLNRRSIGNMARRFMVSQTTPLQPVSASSTTAPVPLLPSHPGWIAAYWRAWRDDQNLPAAVDALAQVRALQTRGLDDEAFTAACEFMDGAAADLSPDEDSPPAMTGHWPALATLLVDEVIGVTWSQSSVTWELRLEPPVGLHGLRVAGAVVSLTAEADTGAGIVVAVAATAPFDLTIRTQFTTFHEQAPAGQTRYLLTYLDRTDIFTEDN